MNDKENNAMVRDFSGEAKQELLQYVDSIISKQRWEEIANTIVFYNVSIPVIVSRLGIKECIDSVGNYYSNLINKNKATKRQIEEIFANVQSIDTKYMGKLSQYINTGNLWVKYIDDLSGLIDPNGGNLDIKKYKAILDADKEKLNAANMSVVKTLVSDGKVDEATDYVDVVDNLDLTYDEFMALSDEEKQKMAEEKNDIYKKLLEQMTPADVSDEVKETLDELHRRGYLLSIGSSSRNAKYILERTGIIDKFDAISDGTNIKKSKPDPEVFLKAAEFLGLKPGECGVVEDAYAGIDAAVSGHMTAIAIGDAAGYDKADYKLSTFKDLLDIAK